MTYYHSQYWAYALTLKDATNSVRNLSRSIANAKVDLNPHQVRAALFALQSPLSRGAILADEVGLGKTIEAGLVIAQKWAERKRKILLVTPAFLRKQWAEELKEKFGLPCRIIDSKTWSEEVFSTEEILICSYEFIPLKVAQFKRDWDLVVIDEAHRMRNVYKTSNKRARVIAEVFQGNYKVLLTATPLQNNLMELFGLISVIDPYVFGNELTFRDQFAKGGAAECENLKKRIEPLIVRTLRKQVQEYISFTNRVAITQNFTPNNDEQELYESVSAYLQRKNLAALPNGQRQLITLVLRRILASSSFAIMQTLEAMITRLENMAGPKALAEEMTLEEIDSLDDELKEKVLSTAPSEEVIIQKEKIRQEAAELRSYLELAQKIQKNSKGESLLIALDKAFVKLGELGASRKAVIFTESTRTQAYLYNLLSENGYAGHIVRINGTNTDLESKAIYESWIIKQGLTTKTSSRAVDMKAALVSHFRDQGTILLATEAAGEGVNLQFASLVINYDLPWNPQRIEQRIGRCHRYGQKHDVVVVNFVNTRNEADKRVFELLNEKFKLFEGVFGASDEVLGAIESGVDIEMRIHEVYQTCRSLEEIEAAFNQLRKDLDEQIQTNLQKTKESILHNFDESVAALLKTYQSDAKEALSQREKWLFNLACHELRHPKTSHPFFVHEGVCYCMNWQLTEEKKGQFFCENDPLATTLIDQAKARSLSLCHLTFDYDSYPSKISALEPLIGTSGWLELIQLNIETFENVETLIFVGKTDDGRVIDSDVLEKLFRLEGKVEQFSREKEIPSFDDIYRQMEKAHIAKAESVAFGIFEKEEEKLEAWSEDHKQRLEKELKAIEKEIKEARKASLRCKTLSEKLENQKKIKHLESKRSTKRHELFAEEDKIDRERDNIIAGHQKSLQPSVKTQSIFKLRWTIA